MQIATKINWLGNNLQPPPAPFFYLFWKHLTPQQICNQENMVQRDPHYYSVKLLSKHSSPIRSTLTPIQKASGGPQHSQQRKHPHPTNQAKSSRSQPTSTRQNSPEEEKTQGSNIYRCIFLNKRAEGWVREECFVTWQLQKAFLLTTQKLPATVFNFKSCSKAIYYPINRACYLTRNKGLL